ncbi:MAG: gamma-glutamyltransferase [Pseudomonadota bacterium]|nr:gamma-glutamyltransferase [Pseudomonadota bacterium]
MKFIDKCLRESEISFKPSVDCKCTVAENGMVATAFPDATNAGVKMLECGGNAVDAACASALALGVCEPNGSGIGGQSVAILYINGRTVAIDGSSHAPALAHSSRFKSDKSRKLGYKATTIPSTLAVLAYLNEKYGRLPWKTVVQPAIEIAGCGYRITKLQERLLNREHKNFLQVSSRSGVRYFFKSDGKPYNAGDLFVQNDLAKTLAIIADNGCEEFYRGKIAQQIDADMKKHRGFLRFEDLALIPEVIERKPLKSSYRGHAISVFPPPGSGETLLLILAMMEFVPQELFAGNTPEAYGILADIFYLAFIEYRQTPRNPNTFPQIVDKIGKRSEIAKRLIAHIDKNRGLRFSDPEAIAKQGLGETTHLSVMDGDGNAVGLTQSINLVYGSKAAAEGLGFIYNNYIEAFQYNKPDHYYNLRPGGIPWPCAVPAIIFKQSKPWIVLGSPGSQRIFSSMVQFISGIIDQHLPISEAMIKPRIHSEANGELSLEIERFAPDIIDFLATQGLRLKSREPLSFYMGAIQAVLKCQTGNGFQGVADIRRDGTATGF